MTLEEVMIKVGVDTSQVEPKLLAAQVAVEKTGKTAHKSFLTAGEATEKWRNLLNQVGTQIPGLGQAIQFALNPVVGILGALSAGTLLLKNRIDDLNKKSDELRDKNARPTHNFEGARLAAENAMFSQEEAQFQHDAEVRAKKDPTLKVNLGEGADPRERIKLLGQSRFPLLVDSARRWDALLAAKKAANDIDAATKRELTGARLRDANAEVEQIKKDLPKLLEAAGEEDNSRGIHPTKNAWLMALGLPALAFGKEAVKIGGDNKANEEYEKAKTRMNGLKEEIKRLTVEQRSLTQADNDAKRVLKDKQEAYDSNIKKMKEVEEQMRKLARQLNIQHNVEYNRSLFHQVDPETGGIAYRGIQYRGLQYRPIGRPVKPEDVLPAPKKNLEEMLDLLNVRMDELVKAAKQDGMVVKAKES